MLKFPHPLAGTISQLDANRAVVVALRDQLEKGESFEPYALSYLNDLIQSLEYAVFDLMMEEDG